MKEFVRTLLLTMIVCCWSCSDGGEDLPKPSPKPETSKIEISSSVPVVEQKGGTATITFTTNAAWTASIGSSTSWAKVSPASGTAGTHTLYVTTEANDMFDERNATLTIKAGNTSRSVTITQKQKDALIVTSNKVEIGSNGGDFSIEAKANVSVSYEIEESAKDWISAIESRALTTTTLHFTAKANDKVERRQGNIIVKGGDGLTETVTVYQSGEEVSLVLTTPKDMTIGSEGGTLKIELESNTEIQMEKLDSDWLRQSSSRAMSAYTYYIEVDANETYDERNASITFTSGDKKQIVTITQKQKDALIVTSNKVEIGSNGGDFSIEAKANVSVSYEIEESAKDWISAIESRALTTKALYFTAKANESMERRQGNIILKGGDGLSETITVYQEGEKPTLVITSDDIIVGSDGETIKIELKSNVEYTMTLPQVDWISKEESRAISAYTHYLSIYPNETYDQRNAVVYFQSETEELKDSISITQLQKDAIIVAKNEYDIDPDGGTLELSISTNVDFEVSTSADWIKQNIGSRAMAEKMLNFTISENSEKETREGDIVISFGKLKQTIKVIQESKVRKVLADFYKATNGDNWRYNDNWLSDNPVSSWYGIYGRYGQLLSMVDNKLSGPFPEVLANMMDYFTEFDLRSNKLYGSIPDAVKKHVNWQKNGWTLIRQSVVEEGDINLIESNLYIDNLQIEDLFSDETTVSNLYDIFKKNKLTQITKCHPTDDGMNIEEVIQWLTDNRVNQHLDYESKGLATVIYTGKGSEQEKEELKNSLSQIYGSVEGITWLCGKTPIDDHNNSVSYFFDQNGQLVYKAEYNAICPEWKHELVHERCNNFLRSYLGEPAEHPEFSAEIYTSTDYSRDGEVVALQEATVGQGINMVFLGEAYVDKDMESGGLYEQKMMEAMEAFFSVEPYKSMRERFNVYAVKVVSPNSIFGERGKQAINQNNKLCFEYANKIPNADKNPPMVTVVYRNFVWGSSMGRSYTNMYEDGSFVAYIICGLDDDSDVNTLIHESGGHGFANLLDEYVEPGNEQLTLPEKKKLYLDNVWTTYSWGSNVDWRNDASTVKWAHFLNDNRYANDGLGLYEGAYLYGHGAYRPTENSLMRYNDSPFNAPSREQIYKRIMQRSEGEEWKYDYEEFVKYDEINRNTASRSAIKPLTEAERREYIKNHRPPTFIKGTWRDAMKNGKSNIVVPLR